MKKLTKEKLDQTLFADSAKKIPLTESIDGEIVPLTMRMLLVSLLDKPQRERPLTRDVIKSLDRVETAFAASLDDVIMDDSDLSFLSNHIDLVGMMNRQVYAKIIDVIDSAEDYTKIA